MNTEQDVGRVGKPTGHSQVEPLSTQGLDPTDFDPSRDGRQCGCPICGAKIAFAAIVGEEQRLTWELTPERPDAMLGVETVGGSLKALGDMLRLTNEEDGCKARVYIDTCRMTERGGIAFDLVVAPVVTPRDSDGPRMAETNEDSAWGEAGPARAAAGGIAQVDQVEQP